MDMRIVDVVIGLMLVFAILSLIATAAQEIIATMMNARGRHLERAIKSLLGGSPELFESVLKHPLIGSLSNTGSLSKTDRVPSYIPANLVVSALLHSLARSGRSSTPAQFVGTLPDAYRAAVGKPLEALVSGAENDWSLFEQRLQTWYEQTMDRASGWYKRYTQVCLMGIGMVLAVSLNVDSIAVANKLWTDRDLRDSVSRYAASVAEGRQAGATPSTGAPAKPVTNADPMSRGAQAAGVSKPSDPHEDFRKSRKQLEELSAMGLPIGWREEVRFDWGLLQAVLGWLMTALAISLGAPFWFDLMSKAVRIRGAGQRPMDRSAAERERAMERSARRVERTQPFQSAVNAAEAALTRAEIERIQQVLKVPNGRISGHLDESTRALIAQWQQERNLPSTGELTTQQISRLLAA